MNDDVEQFEAEQALNGSAGVSSPDSGEEDRLTALLIAYDRELAPGESRVSTIDASLSPAITAELAGLQECVDLLDVLRTAGAGGAKRPVPAEEDQVPLAGEQIGRFELVRELGRGGYGVVFLARDPGLDRLVALKVPRPEALVTPDLRRRFLREAQAAGRLSHPHLVRVHEAGEDGALCYLVSEYCSGPSLAQWLKEKDRPVEFRAAATLVAVLADGLEHAHRAGVLHRDIKPGNVLLAPRPDEGEHASTQCLSFYVAKLGDFGLAKLIASQENETRSGALLGTPAYMPPEQAAGRLDEVGPTADIYGLGAILYELLTGRAPFVGGNDVDTLRVNVGPKSQRLGGSKSQRPKWYVYVNPPQADCLCGYCGP